MEVRGAEDPKPPDARDGGRRVRLGQYILGDTLGHGSFGKVKLARHEITQHTVAVKILNKEKIELQKMDIKIGREIRILKLLQHPHVIRLYEVIDTPTDIFLVMEYVSGGELFHYIVQNWPLPLDQVRRFFQQIIAGVEYIHYYRVVHRDLKPENVLLDQDLNVKIADFGLSNLMKDGDFLRTSCGSPNYASPEIITGQLYAGPEVDVWGCGVILYALLCGRLPFDEEHMSVLFRKIKDGEYVLPECLPAECKDLISRMLVTDPLQRITISQVRAHPFFQEQLPAHLAMPPERSLNDGRAMVDHEVLGMVAEKMDVPYDIALKALMSGTKTPISVAYWIFCHQKGAREPNSGDGTEEGGKIVRGARQDNPLQPSPVMEGLLNLRRNPRAAAAVHEYNLDASAAAPPSGATLPVHKNWRLGVVCQHRCHVAMKFVYTALKQLGLQWRVVSPFHVVCKWVDDAGRRPVNVAVQVYRMLESSRKGYLIDLSVAGPETMPSLVVVSQLHAILTDMQRGT
eukprot:EG_transcript_5553